MQNVVVADVLVGIKRWNQRWPPFSLGRLSQPAIDNACSTGHWGFDQVLLNKCHAESVFHLISHKFFVGPISSTLDEKFSRSLLKARVPKSPSTDLSVA